MNKETTKMIPGDELHLTMLMAPYSLNLVIGQDRQHLLAFGRAAFEAGKAGQPAQCLHQIAEPAAALTEQDAALLNQGIELLLAISNDERNRGNCSAAEGATASAYAVQRLAAALLTTQHAAPLAAVHPDDAAVDALAALMKAKLAKQRAKGYGGWNDKTQCPQQRLSDMLRAHVDKGDPVDVANFCAMLSARGEGIAAAPQAVQAAVLAHLDGLLDDAAAHIYPSDLRMCQTSECTVTVASVRMGNREERSIPLFSREQVVEAFDAALAAQTKQRGA